MTIPNTYILLAMLGALALTAWTVFGEFPALIGGLLRCRLWTLRDQVKDDLLAGDIPEQPLTKQLLASVDYMAAHPTQFTFANWIVSPTVPDEERARRRAARQAEIDVMDAPARERVEFLLRKYRRLFMAMLLLASVSGWFVLLVASVPLAFEVTCNAIRAWHTNKFEPLLAGLDATVRHWWDRFVADHAEGTATPTLCF